MKKFIQYIPFLLILCVSATLFIKVNQDGKDAGKEFLSESQMVGKQVADFPLDVISPKGAEGLKLNNESYKGGFTVINLFASWCIACLHEHQYIKQLKGTKNLKVVGIAWRDKKEESLDWLKTNGNPYDKVGLDNQGKFGILMGVTGIPETFLIDENGKILTHFARVITKDDIEQIKEQVERK